MKEVNEWRTKNVIEFLHSGKLYINLIDLNHKKLNWVTMYLHLVYVIVLSTQILHNSQTCQKPKPNSKLEGFQKHSSAKSYTRI